MHRLAYIILLFVSLTLTCTAQDSDALHPVPQLRQLRSDSTLTRGEKLRESRNIFIRFIKAFDEYDTTYIEPNLYNWTVMLQGTTTNESFSLTDRQGLSRLAFGSRPGMKIGPYLGWRFIFLGYTIDVTTIGRQKSSKTEFELSLYSSMLGADLFYRRTGTDFNLRRAIGFEQGNGQPLDLFPHYGQQMDGIRVSITGANVYYIANHRQFSLPAAFSQSTVQRRSAGSWKFGLSVTRHNINVDYQRLEDQMPELQGCNPFQTAKMDYMDYSLSAGYAYNWVFHRNWLFSIDLAPALGYKRTHRSLWLDDPTVSLTPTTSELMHRFFVSRGNVNFNVTGRLGLVWNNAHHYAGLSLIAHNFNYRYNDLSMHNSFFTLNLYTGINFMRKKGK